jgi:2,5-diketo-D-gluconate reductase A
MCADSELESWTSREQSLLLRWAGPSCAQGEAHLREIAEAGLPLPAANQLELHPLCQKRALLALMREQGVAPIAYSSLAPLSSFREGYTKYPGSKSAEERAAAQSDAAPLAVLAGRLGVCEARLLLRYGVQKGWAVLPKSARPERIATNFDLGFVIDDEGMQALDEMEAGRPLAWGTAGQSFDPTNCS